MRWQSQDCIFFCRPRYANDDGPDEGGANIIFSIFSGDHDLPERLQGKLLRLRKGVSHVQNADEQLKAIEDNFTGLFPPHSLIQHEVITLDASVPMQLNTALQNMVRPRHRAGDFLPSEEMTGFLITDMTARHPGQVLLQLKPKWLTQSPNAPPDAQRCRTCAVRAQRASERIRTATDAQETCPLDLVNVDAAERRRAAAAFTPDPLLREYLATRAQPLLQQLRAAQLAFDAHGILKTSGTEQIVSLCKAMTLRDCSLYLRRTGDAVEARLGDLDLKQPEKLMRWKRTEQLLINGGWYANKEDARVWTKEKICLLARPL